MFNLLKKRDNSKRPRIYYLEVPITNNCNLSCNICARHCNLIDKEQFADIEQFKKDITELSKKIDIGFFKLSGGEPLLTENICDFIEMSRKLLPDSYIVIHTNGILLPEMKNKFWEALRNNKIALDISKLPISSDKFSQMLDLIDDNDITLHSVFLRKKCCDNFNKEGTSEPQKAFDACIYRKKLTLWKQKLYTCYACYREIYNKQYGTNLPLPNAIDIYSSTGNEIQDQIYKPSPACRFCREQLIFLPRETYLK